MTATRDFDWKALEERCIVQQRVMRVAIYSNPSGDVVIRQERDWDEEDDPFIIIARANVPAAIEQMLMASGHEAPEVVRSAHQPKDPTAAERQRRRREKLKRDAEAESRVTDRDELSLQLIAAE
jgi:hypothetical protein